MRHEHLKKTLRKLKQLDFRRASASFWLIKRGGKPAAPELRALFVDTEPHLQTKLSGIVRKAVEEANEVQPYDYFTSDGEENEVLGVRATDTGFDVIQQQIEQGSAAPKITSPKDFHDSWAYLIDVVVGADRVMAVRKVVGGWAIKKQSAVLKVLFKNAVLADYEEAPVFQLEKKVDFIAFEGSVFILNKSHFESVMNFRAGMEAKRDEVVQDFTRLGIVTDPDIVRDAIGQKLNMLRRVASVRKSGFYKDSGFIQKLKDVCEQHGWGIEWNDGKIIVTPENVETILKLLNDDRLESPVTAGVYDVTVKHKVG